MREKFKTWGGVFDRFTLFTIQKLIDKRLFDELESPLFVGKESNVFTALKGAKKVIVKIYRLETCDFNRMYDYLKFDGRYQHVKRRKRQIIFAWVQREYRNLLKARETGVRVPTPLAVLNNILVLEFIGDEAAAPKLKDSVPEDPERFLKAVTRQMKQLYKGGLVHADLSAFNILNYHEKPVVIDMSQSTNLDNMLALEYLQRDVKNICVFFRKWGVDCEEERLLREITG